MMSPTAYEIASLLMTGAMTLHELRIAFVHLALASEDEVEATLRRGLLELVEHGWVRWDYEPDYGNVNKSAEHPPRFDVENFELHWRQCTRTGWLSVSIPDADFPTMFFAATERLHAELDKPEYG